MQEFYRAYSFIYIRPLDAVVFAWFLEIHPLHLL